MAEPHTDRSGYVVTLTPRQFEMTNDDWHIKVQAPDGREVWESASWRWLARLKARWIVRGMRCGRYEDSRRQESFHV
jgi:hypothetical protein